MSRDVNRWKGTRLSALLFDDGTVLIEDGNVYDPVVGDLDDVIALGEWAAAAKRAAKKGAGGAPRKRPRKGP